MSFGKDTNNIIIYLFGRHNQLGDKSLKSGAKSSVVIYKSHIFKLIGKECLLVSGLLAYSFLSKLRRVMLVLQPSRREIHFWHCVTNTVPPMGVAKGRYARCFYVE
jgi:hypothetical protein